MAGIYIHIPFCSQFCIYCDFYSVKQTGKIDDFIRSLLSEIELRRDFFVACNSKPVTIYIGGGTPSLLSSGKLSLIIDSLRRNFGISNMNDIEEFTIEVNPDDISREYLLALRALGINRLSMGIQSFADEDLKWMNRRHNSAKAVESYFTARECGFDNISLDLIFGYSLLTMEKWRNNLKKMIELRPEHISSYQLGIERGTKLGKEFAQGTYLPLPEDICYEQYSMLQDLLNESGYNQYEISNFALTGREARHNSAYWNHTPYLGLGPSAHSFNGSVRSWNYSDLNRYISNVMTSKGYFREEVLSHKDIFNEKIMLSLRKVSGLDLKKLQEDSNPGQFKIFKKQLDYAIEKGLVVLDGENIKIPSDKLFVSDGIIRDLIL